MAAGDPILSLSDLIFLCTGGGGGAPEAIPFHKSGLVGGAAPGTLVAGRMVSLWLYDGQPGAATAVPTTAVVVTNATPGSLLQTTSAAGTRKRLLSISAGYLNQGSHIVYDRLVQHGGLDGTVTTAQTTNLPTAALTRHTSGIGVEQWAETYTQVGASSTTLKTSYSNTTPSSGQVSPLITFGNAGFREAQRILPIGVVAGDKGVTAVASVTVTATTSTAGNFGITLAFPLVTLPVGIIGAGYLWSGLMTAGGPLDLGIASDACLAFAWVCNGTTAPAMQGNVYFMEK